MNILAIDTATQTAAVAVAQDTAILCEAALTHKKTHSQKILPLIDRALNDLELTIRDMDVFAVSVGPGSFTGLRIGVAMAKSFAHVLGKPIVGVSTLETLAANVACFPGTVVPLLFARADEAFYAAFAQGERKMEDGVASLSQILRLFEREPAPLLFVGDAALRWREEIVAVLGERAQFAEDVQCIQRASSLAHLAYRRVLAGKTDDCFALAPAYLRPSQAEREFG